MEAPAELTTSRLLIRPFCLEDAPFILELLNDPSFIDNIADKKVRTLEDARSYLCDGPLASYERFGIGLCCVVSREDGASIGMAGLLQRDHLEYPDLGYAFLPRYCGKGHALEASKAILDHARRNLGITTVAAIVSAANARSIHLLEKLGFSRAERTEAGLGDSDVDLYLSR